MSIIMKIVVKNPKRVLQTVYGVDISKKNKTEADNVTIGNGDKEIKKLGGSKSSNSSNTTNINVVTIDVSKSTTNNQTIKPSSESPSNT